MKKSESKFIGRLPKRLLSILLSVLLVFGTIAVGGIITAQASGSLSEEIPEQPEDIIFSVPEVIYLRANTLAATANANFHIFVDNELPATITTAVINNQVANWGALSTNATKDFGEVFFYCPNATMVRIEMLTTGVTIAATRQTRRNFNAGAMATLNATPEAELNADMLADLGGHNTFTNVTAGIAGAITNGTPVFGNFVHYRIGQTSTAPNNTGLITWRASYLVGGVWYTAYAHSYVYQPDHIPTAMSVMTRHVGGTHDFHTMNWVNGLHFPIAAGHCFQHAPSANPTNAQREVMVYTLLGYPNLLGNPNNTAGAGGGGLALPGLNDNTGGFPAQALREAAGNSGRVHFTRLTANASAVNNDPSRRGASTINGTGQVRTNHQNNGGDANLAQNGIQMIQFPQHATTPAFNNRQVNLFVDTSRYTNFNQIPNLSAWATRMGSWGNNGNLANGGRNQDNFIAWSHTTNPMVEAPNPPALHGVTGLATIPAPVNDSIQHNNSGGNNVTLNGRRGIYAFGGNSVSPQGAASIVTNLNNTAVSGSFSFANGTQGSCWRFNYRGLGLTGQRADAELHWLRGHGTSIQSSAPGQAQGGRARFKWGGTLNIPMQINLGSGNQFNSPSIVFRWHGRSGDLIRSDGFHYRAYMNLRHLETNKGQLRTNVQNLIVNSHEYQYWMFDNHDELVGSFTRWEIYRNAMAALAYALCRPDFVPGIAINANGTQTIPGTFNQTTLNNNIANLYNAVITARGNLNRATAGQTGLATANYWNMAPQPPVLIDTSTLNYTLNARIVANPQAVSGFEFEQMNVPGVMGPVTTTPGSAIANADTQRWDFFYVPVFHAQFNANGASGTTPANSGDIVWGRATAETFPNAGGLALANHSLAGWSLNDDGTGVVYLPGAPIPNTLHNQPGAVQLYAVWAADEHTITYDPGAGTGTPHTVTNIFGTAHAILSNSVPELGFTKANFSLVGWNTAANGTGTAFALNGAIPDTNAENLTLYAQWQGNTFNVTYRGNGGLRSNNSADTFVAEGRFGVEYTAARNNVVLFERDHRFTFVGWNTAANGTGTAFAQGEAIPEDVAAGLILYAQWLGVHYTVNYNAGTGAGGPFAHSNVGRFGQPYYVLANTDSRLGFTKLGHDLIGWNTDPVAAAAGTVQFAQNLRLIGDEVANLTQAVTLYAVWSTSSFNVYYHINDGMGAAAVINTGTYGTPYTVRTAASLGFDRGANFVFTGWNTQANGQGTNVAESAIFDNDSAVGLVLFAQWNGAPYTVTFDANGGTGGPTDTAGQFGVPLTLPVSVPTRTNFTFAGWNTQANGGGTAFTAGQTITNDSLAGQTLYAQWTGDAFTVLYRPNGGVGTEFSHNGQFGTAYTILGNTMDMAFEREYFRVDRWNTQADGLGTNYAIGDTVPADDAGPLVLYAVWELVSQNFNVRYRANGGAGNEVTTTGTFGTVYTIDDNPGFTRANYVFAGWNTAADGTGDDFAPSDEIPDTNYRTVTLYAQWAPRTITISFVPGNGDTLPDATVTFGSAFGAGINWPADPIRAGYDFVGWFGPSDPPIPNVELEVRASDTVEWVSDRVLTARWTAQTAPVDKTELDAQITLVQGTTQGNFTSFSWRTFELALEAAEDVFADPNATQAQVDTARNNLAAAYAGLTPMPTTVPTTASTTRPPGGGGGVPPTTAPTTTTTTRPATTTARPTTTTTAAAVNRAALQAKITQVQGTVQGNFTNATWRAFQAALNAAQNVNANSAATQAQIDQALADLTTAFNGLRVVAGSFFPNDEVRLQRRRQHDVFRDAAAAYGRPVTFRASPDRISISSSGEITFRWLNLGAATVTMYDAETNQAIDTVQVRVIWVWWQWILVLLGFGWIYL